MYIFYKKQNKEKTILTQQHKIYVYTKPLSIRTQYITDYITCS